ncbi:MFS transporter [Microvirga massiliensis]|uniref:MFS transporter n=1 Tax=Microvirga massiliensis TaxID=1033741 RepID=UPI00062BAE0F|nr:MFS transporter [Microvirga massiliensis]
MGSTLSLIWTITLTATILQASNGLLQALLPLRMQADGLPVTAIGLVATAYGAGFVVGCFMAPKLIRRVGHIRAFASLAATAAVVALAFTTAQSVLAWIILRALSGIALAGVFTVMDGWISARATPSIRGRVLSIYMICTKLALMLSPLGIGLGNVRTDGLFMLVAAMMCLSLLPVSASRTKEPPSPKSTRIDIAGLFDVAPSAVVGAFAVGLVNAPVMAIAPVFGVSVGLDQAEAAALLVALQGGSLVLQWPLGWLSDRIDRRYVIAGLAAGTCLVSIGILMASRAASPGLLVAGFAVWGGLALCIYSICVAHACDLIEPGQIVATVGTLLVCWAIGSTIGPVPGTAMMAWLGPGGLFIYSAGVVLGLAIFIVIRILQLRRPVSGGGFVALAPTSPANAALSPRLDEDSPGGRSTDRHR